MTGVQTCALPILNASIDQILREQTGRTVAVFCHGGVIRGILSPPEVALPEAEPQTSRGPTPSWREATRALLLGAGSVSEDRFWSESWTSAERVLHDLVGGAVARELTLTPCDLDAHQAHAKGLVTRVVADDARSTRSTPRTADHP